MGKKSKLVEFWTRNFFQIRACVIMSARKAKHLDATTMFSYSHANTPTGQSERAYHLSYFINVCCMFSVGVSPHDELLRTLGANMYSNMFKYLNIRTGPVNRRVFAIHTELSLFLKLKWNFQKVSWNFWSANFHESVRTCKSFKSLFNVKGKKFSGNF